MTNDPKKKHLKLVTNEDLKKILESRSNASGFVTMLHPLELFMSREQLESLTRESLEAIKTNRPTTETADERLASDRAIQQRVDFLSWLTGQPEQVYMALYPAEMDGLDELDDMADLIEDPDNPLPF
jgi:hypothetical protein